MYNNHNVTPYLYNQYGQVIVDDQGKPYIDPYSMNQSQRQVVAAYGELPKNPNDAIFQQSRFANSQFATGADETEELINMALHQHEGKVALANAMANPIRVTLDYQSVGRKLLMVDPLPQGALPVYDKDIEASAVTISKRGGVPELVIEGDRFQVTTWELASFPTVRFSQVRDRRFNIIDRAQQRAKSELMAAEDGEIFAALEETCTGAGAINNVTTSTGSLTRLSLTQAFQQVERHDLVVSTVLMNAQEFADIRAWGQNEFDPVTQREVLQTGLYGRLWTADILISRRVPPGSVYILADKEFVGVMPIRQEVQVIPADMPRELSLGWVVYEEIGVGFLNNKSVSKIEID